MRTSPAILLSLALAACFGPDLGDRPFKCGAARQCPPGYRCNLALDCVRTLVPAAPDGAVPDGRIIDARLPDAGAAACKPACGPSSCSNQTCGRSPCGYPCGDCPVSSLASPCIDHYGQMLDEGGRGLRSCAADAEQLEQCTCTGGGSSAWTACNGGCQNAGCSRVGQIGCGFQSCEPGEVCCRRGRESSCSTTACAGVPMAKCDGPEDCAGGVCCAGDLPETAVCVTGTTCGALLTHCHSTEDCPVITPLCCATSTTSGTKACYATPQGGGCN